MSIKPGTLNEFCSILFFSYTYLLFGFEIFCSQPPEGGGDDCISHVIYFETQEGVERLTHSWTFNLNPCNQKKVSTESIFIILESKCWTGLKQKCRWNTCDHRCWVSFTVLELYCDKRCADIRPEMKKPNLQWCRGAMLHALRCSTSEPSSGMCKGPNISLANAGFGSLETKENQRSRQELPATLWLVLLFWYIRQRLLQTCQHIVMQIRDKCVYVFHHRVAQKSLRQMVSWPCTVKVCLWQRIPSS